MTALRNLSVDSRKMWRIRLPSAIDERDLDTVAARHDYSEAYRRIMAQLNVLFVQEFADACHERKPFSTQQERMVDSSMDAVDSPILNFMYRKSLKKISRAVRKYGDLPWFLDELEWQLMQAVDVAVEKVCSRANRPSFREQVGLSVKVELSDLKSFAENWIRKYVMIREFCVKNMLAENPFEGGFADCIHCITAKGVSGKIAQVGKSTASWIRDSIVDSDRNRDPQFLEGLKVGRALSEDVDLFTIRARKERIDGGMRLSGVSRFRIRIDEIAEDKVREPSLADAIWDGVFKILQEVAADQRLPLRQKTTKDGLTGHDYVVEAHVIEGFAFERQGFSVINGSRINPTGSLDMFRKCGNSVCTLNQGDSARIRVSLKLPPGLSLTRGCVIESDEINVIRYLGCCAGTSVLDELRHNGWNVNERGADGLSAIDWAVLNSLDKLKYLVENMDASVDNDGDGGRGVLIRAAKARTPDRMKIVRYLAEDCCVGALTSDVCQKNGIDEEDVLNYFNSLKEA